MTVSFDNSKIKLQFLLANDEDTPFQKGCTEETLNSTLVDSSIYSQLKVSRRQQQTNGSSVRETGSKSQSSSAKEAGVKHQSVAASSNNVNKMWRCSYCGKLLSSNANMNKHIKTVHKKIKNLQCPWCDLKFHQGFNLQRHIKRIHIKENDCS